MAERGLLVVTLSEVGLPVSRRLAAGLPAGLAVHRAVEGAPRDAIRFDNVRVLTSEHWSEFRGWIYVMPAGVVVRALAGVLGDKKRDPGVVATDVHGRWAISLLSGHEGGANRLSIDVANLLDAEPIITTTTEAEKRLIAGVGCRRGISARAILDALEAGCGEAGVTPSAIRLLASAELKKDERGLLEAADTLKIPVRFIHIEQLRRTCYAFETSSFVEERTGLPAVAEPCALLAGRRTQLRLPKRILNGVTVALASEDAPGI